MKTLVLPAKEKWQDPNLIPAWQQLLKNSTNLDKLYQSVHYFEHLAIQKKFENLYVLFLLNDSDEIKGIVPVSIIDYKLKFALKGHSLYQLNFNTIFILGSDPLIDGQDDVYDALFESIFENFGSADCVYFESVRTESKIWRYLDNSISLKKRYLKYLPENFRSYHSMTLPESFDQYLASLSRNSRKDFNRRKRKLEDNFNADLQVKRFTSEDQIDDFLSSAFEIVKDSWQKKILGDRIRTGEDGKNRYKDLAKRGLFHAYILYVGAEPVAFDMGHRYEETYLGVETAYKQSLKHLSPGIVLQILLIEDLIDLKEVMFVNFGYGEGDYKKKLCNNHTEDASVMLFKKSITNRVRIFSHTVFMTIKRKLKTPIKS